MTENRWLLPEGIDELLPPHASRLEKLCRRILDLYESWGYQLVTTPLIEYLESLLTGTGEDLDLQTFKLTDQLSGRMMGIRADITPQVARIDAHKMNQDCPSRLCYLGTILHTKPEDKGGSRSPLQVGAELYGHSGVESDAEVMCLMLETMKLAGVKNIFVDLSHVGIYQAIVEQSGLSVEQEFELFDILQRKAGPELDDLLPKLKLKKNISDAFRYLIKATGDKDILVQARKKLDHIKGANKCLDEIESVVEIVTSRFPEISLNFDLTELRGYHYHTGIVFAAYVIDKGQGIAYGGRYDSIGSAFGRARPATGFSTDVKLLLQLSDLNYPEPGRIFAPVSKKPGLEKAIDKLRKKGEIVIKELPGQTGKGKDLLCNKRLSYKNGKWLVESIK